MSKQQLEKFLVSQTPEKPCQDQSLVQVTPLKLNPIAGEKDGDLSSCLPWQCGQNHNEIIVSTTDVRDKGQETFPSQSKMILTP